MEKNLIKSPALQKEFLRISNQIISQSLNDISDDTKENDELVHTLRKRVKNVRTILKLLRKEVGEEFYKKNNFLLRDLNRRSASIRNYFAIINLVQSNLELADNKQLKEALTLLELRLKADFENVRNNTDYSTLFSNYKTQLGKYQTHLNKFNVDESRFGIIKAGLLNIYTEGQDLLNLCIKTPTDKNLHEWRKTTKDFYYITNSLSPIWKPVYTAYAKEIKALSDILGMVNDYFELNHYIQSLVDNPYDFSMLIDLIDTNRQKLITKAYQLGRRIYAIDSDSFIIQFKAYFLCFKKDF
jgi:CHAD domain-containing protein